MKTILFLLAVIASVFSQLPMVVNTPLGDTLKASWLIPFAISLLDFKSIRIRSIIGFIAFLLSFLLFCLIMESLTGKQYNGADLRNIAICCLVFVTSNIVFHGETRTKLIKLLPPCLVIVGLIMSVFIFINYELVESLNTSLYVYEAKNSMSTILASIIVVAVFFYRPNRIIWKCITTISIIAIFIVTILLRSRATIIGLVFAIVYFVLSINNRVIKRTTVSLLIALVVAIVVIPSWQTVVIDQIFYAGRDVVDVNALSSGRIERFPELFQLISDSPFIGNGNIYFDCMPVVVLAQYGIIGASMIFVFLMVVFTKLFKQRKFDDIHRTAFVLYCVFLINSLFEAQAPFGPGIKCFILWIIIGFAYSEPSRVSITSCSR